MIKNFIVSHLLVLLATNLFAQITTIPTPSWVDKVAFENSNVLSEKVNGGQAFLLVDRQYNIEREEVYLHYSFKILSEVGIQNGSTIEINFDPTYEKLLFIGIDVYRDKEKINQLNLDKFQVIQKEANAERFIYDGKKTAILHLNDIRVGDVIDYKFILKGRNPIFRGKFYASFYLNFQEPIGRNYIKIQVPVQRKFNIKSFETNIEPIVEEGIYKTYLWDLKDVEGFLYDSSAPSWYNPYAKVQVSEYEKWSEVNDWALPLYASANNDLSAVHKKATLIKRENEKRADQIEAALNFVQDEIRYLGFESGLNSYAPHPPSKIIAQRFGDCKDKSLLLVTLLNALGVEAYAALVHSSEGELLPAQLPGPDVFDHCVVKAVIDGHTYWYDPTIANQGGNYASTYFPDYKYALVIKKGTSDLEAIKPVAPSKVESRETFTIEDYDQPVSLHVSTFYTGKEADYQRQYFMKNSLAQIQKNYLSYYAETYPKLKAVKELGYDDSPDVNIFITYEDYEIEGFWKPLDKNNKGIIRGEVYPQMVREVLTDPGQINRSAPLHISYPKNVNQIIELYLPDKWDIEGTSNKIEAPGIEYADFVTYFDNKITLGYSIETLKDHLKPEEIDDYHGKMSQIKQQLGYVLTYNKDMIQASGSANVNWLISVISLMVLIVSLFVAKKVYFGYDPYSPNKRIAYEKIGGWLILIGIGITISPFYILFTIFTQNYFDHSLWINITSASSANYNPVLAISFLIELLINIVSFVFTILLLVLFYKRRSSFPRLVIIFYVFNFLFMAVDAAVISSLGILNDTALMDSYKAIGKSFITMVIWVPYFLKSDRVKETFVNMIKNQEEEVLMQTENVNI